MLIKDIFDTIISIYLHTTFSFFPCPTSFYLTRLGVEGYYSFGHTQWHTTVGRTPLDEGSARRRDLYLTTHTTEKHQCPQRDSNPQSQQASGFRPQALDRSATGIGYMQLANWKFAVRAWVTPLVTHTDDRWQRLLWSVRKVPLPQSVMQRRLWRFLRSSGTFAVKLSSTIILRCWCAYSLEL